MASQPNPRWKKRPEGSTWGDWGPDDELGRMNLLTVEKVKQGLAEAKEGVRFNLNLPMNLPGGGNALNPRRHPPKLSPTVRTEPGFEGAQNFNIPMSIIHPLHTDVVNDDKVELTLQYSSQWDGLSHVGSQFDMNADGKPVFCFYNGFRAGVDIIGACTYDPNGKVVAHHNHGHIGANKLGINNLAEHAVQGRGVMFDLEKHFGHEKRYISYTDIQKVFKEDNIVVESGDMLFFHTAFAQLILDMKGSPDMKVLHNSCAGLNGRDPELLKWITETGCAALVADNYAVEQLPALPPSGEAANKPHAWLPLHEHALFKLGVNLGEIWYLTKLAMWLREHKRSRFFVTAPGLNLPGAVGAHVPATDAADWPYTRGADQYVVPREVYLPTAADDVAREYHERAISAILKTDASEERIHTAEPSIEISVAHGWDKVAGYRINVVTDSASLSRPEMWRNNIATRIMTGPELMRKGQEILIAGRVLLIAKPRNVDAAEFWRDAVRDFTLDDLEALLGELETGVVAGKEE